MQYPLISEYVRAIHNAGDNLGELAHLVPVLDNHGEPYRSSGAFAVVFKMKDGQTDRRGRPMPSSASPKSRKDGPRLIGR